MSKGAPVILAVDSSGKTAGVCLTRGKAELFCETLNAGLTHSETLLPLVRRALQSAGVPLCDVDLLAVCGGPGSFTGLRIGCALVKGLALAKDTPAVAVSTLQALATAAALQPGALKGVIIPALDARRGEVYWAAFDSRPFDGRSPLPRLCPDAAGPVQEIGAEIAQWAKPVYFVGDGAHLCYNGLGAVPGVAECALPQPLPIARGAAALALQAWQNGQTAPASALRPRYLRLSQAERERQKRLMQYEPVFNLGRCQFAQNHCARL